MPLTKSILNDELNKAFSDAMYKFLEISAQLNGNEGKDKSVESIEEASETFAAKASTSIDAYIRSGLVTTVVATTVATAGSALAQTGAGAGTGTGAIT